MHHPFFPFKKFRGAKIIFIINRTSLWQLFSDSYISPNIFFRIFLIWLFCLLDIFRFPLGYLSRSVSIIESKQLGTHKTSWKYSKIPKLVVSENYDISWRKMWAVVFFLNSSKCPPLRIESFHPKALDSREAPPETQDFERGKGNKLLDPEFLSQVLLLVYYTKRTTYS